MFPESNCQHVIDATFYFQNCIKFQYRAHIYSLYLYGRPQRLLSIHGNYSRIQVVASTKVGSQGVLQKEFPTPVQKDVMGDNKWL
jgi:hypothetical protein